MLHNIAAKLLSLSPNGSCSQSCSGTTGPSQSDPNYSSFFCAWKTPCHPPRPRPPSPMRRHRCDDTCCVLTVLWTFSCVMTYTLLCVFPLQGLWVIRRQTACAVHLNTPVPGIGQVLGERDWMRFRLAWCACCWSLEGSVEPSHCPELRFLGESRLQRLKERSPAGKLAESLGGCIAPRASYRSAESALRMLLHLRTPCQPAD